MENIIDQKQIDKVVELNEKFNKCVVVLEDAVQISNECIKSLEQLKEIAIDEEKIDWKEKYNIAFRLLTEKDNKIKELEGEVDRILISRDKWRENFRMLNAIVGTQIELKEPIIEKASTCETMATIISECKKSNDNKITLLFLGLFIGGFVASVLAMLK